MDRRNAFEPLWKRLTRGLNRKHAQILELERRVFDPQNTRAIIANSAMVRDEILARFPYPADQIHIVRNGIQPWAELPERETARKKFRIDTEVLCLLFLGTGWERKGLTTAIGALDKLDSATLLVAGRGQNGVANTEYCLLDVVERLVLQLEYHVVAALACILDFNLSLLYTVRQVVDGLDKQMLVLAGIDNHQSTTGGQR
jgi:glycosyltransferase involved in cell wall biosynthesis